MDTTVSMLEPNLKDGQIVTNGGRVLGSHCQGKNAERGKKERICCY